jgi:hypothetical protein
MKQWTRRYRSEQRLYLWLQFRNRFDGWQHWAVWRWVGWAILAAVLVTVVSMCYAYR